MDFASPARWMDGFCQNGGGDIWGHRNKWIEWLGVPGRSSELKDHSRKISSRTEIYEAPQCIGQKSEIVPMATDKHDLGPLQVEKPCRYDRVDGENLD